MGNKQHDLNRLHCLARVNVYGKSAVEQDELDKEYRALKSKCEAEYGFETTYQAVYYGFGLEEDSRT